MTSGDLERGSMSVVNTMTSRDLERGSVSVINRRKLIRDKMPTGRGRAGPEVKKT